MGHDTDPPRGAFYGYGQRAVPNLRGHSITPAQLHFVKPW
jgi:hypothetical protein